MPIIQHRERSGGSMLLLVQWHNTTQCQQSVDDGTVALLQQTLSHKENLCFKKILLLIKNNGVLIEKSDVLITERSAGFPQS